VRRGLALDVPVLALFGEKDVVMNVDVNAALAPRVGTDVTCVRIPDAVHDVFLSGPAVREKAFAAAGTWLEAAGFAPSGTASRETA
jgi:alpha-beta hydrolase superfamily lysophospholipase